MRSNSDAPSHLTWSVVISFTFFLFFFTFPYDHRVNQVDRHRNITRFFICQFIFSQSTLSIHAFSRHFKEKAGKVSNTQKLNNLYKSFFFSLKCINLLTLSCCYEKKVDYKIQLTLESDSSTGWTLHTDVCG